MKFFGNKKSMVGRNSWDGRIRVKNKELEVPNFVSNRKRKARQIHFDQVKFDVGRDFQVDFEDSKGTFQGKHPELIWVRSGKDLNTLEGNVIQVKVSFIVGPDF